jgi:hypothetical protein
VTRSPASEEKVLHAAAAMIPQTAMDLEGAAGFRRTKDEHSKEPALVVQRNTCCKYLSCIFLVLLAAGLFVWQSDAAFRRIAPMLAAKRARARAAQHTAHSRFTSIGQELEQHLEQEMKETEIALRLRSRLRELEKLHRKNVTRALDAAAIGDAAVTFQARDAVKPYLEDAVDALFEELRSVIDARILQPMMSSGAQAKQRHDALHQEVLEELRKDKVERDAFLKAKHAQPGDIDGDGFQEHTDDYTPNWSDPVWKSKFYGTFVLNLRVDLHAIDACSTAWRCEFLTARPSQEGRVIAEK